MSLTDEQIRNIIKRIEMQEDFNGDSLTTTSNIIKRLEKLEQFKADTIKDIQEITDLVEVELLKDKTEDLLSDTVKNKIIRNFLELNKETADEDVARLMAIPPHKIQSFQREDLENCEKVQWACKILLEYIGDYDDDE